jgi:4-hydroxy-tetrahydrodipicolinate synthase
MPHSDAAKLRGLSTAILTPFDAHGDLRLEHMPALLDFQRQAGIDGVVVCGTNGEGTSLSVGERKQTLETAMAHREGLLVVAATGAASVTDAVELTKHAAMVGADATLALPPIFYKNPTAQGLADYFLRVLDAADLPCMLYNIPQFSAVIITDELLALLADHPNLSGIKDSTGDWASTNHFITAYPQLRIFPGSDRLLARGLAAGAAGAISGGANALPELMVAIHRAHHAQPNGESAMEAQKRLDAVIDITLRYPLIAVSKSVIANRGLPRLSVRSPLVNLSPTQEESLLRELRAIGALPH